MTPRFATSAALLAAAALAHSASAQSFTLIGAAPNAAQARALGISGDGSTVVGASYRDSTPSFQAGWKWTATTGRVDTGLSPEFPQYSAFLAANSDGRTVVGYGAGSNANTYAIRYSGPGTFQNLGRLPGHNSAQATGVSGDSSVVVGRSYLYSQGNEIASSAFRWTAATGMQPITSEFSKAYGVSADGNTIVGEIRNGAGINAFKWTPAGGAEILPRIAGTSSGYAFAVSADGLTTVGRCEVTATMWRNGVPTPLSTIALGQTTAIACNADGSVIGGYGVLGIDFTATVWTPSSGMVYLSDYLAQRGVSIPSGVQLYQCTAISADGRTFAGIASDGVTPQGFVATIPAPATAIAFAALILGSPRRHR